MKICDFHKPAFGEEVFSGKSPWRFSSKRVDNSGLVYYGRRYYQPHLGRWLTPDPAGFTDGMNLYAFVHNDPLTHCDEYGLFTMPLPAKMAAQDFPAYRHAMHFALDTWHSPRFQGSM